MSEENENICVWTCIIVNYHLTDAKISPHVYDHLKKQFIKEEKHKISTTSGFQCYNKAEKKKISDTSRILQKKNEK